MNTKRYRITIELDIDTTNNTEENIRLGIEKIVSDVIRTGDLSQAAATVNIVTLD